MLLSLYKNNQQAEKCCDKGGRDAGVGQRPSPPPLFSPTIWADAQIVPKAFLAWAKQLAIFFCTALIRGQACLI